MINSRSITDPVPVMRGVVAKADLLPIDKARNEISDVLLLWSTGGEYPMACVKGWVWVDERKAVELVWERYEVRNEGLS